MTQDEFDNLPMLITRGDLMRITGLDRETIRSMRLQGMLPVAPIPGSTGNRHRYHRECVRIIEGMVTNLRMRNTDLKGAVGRHE